MPPTRVARAGRHGQPFGQPFGFHGIARLQHGGHYVTVAHARHNAAVLQDQDRSKGIRVQLVREWGVLVGKHDVMPTAHNRRAYFAVFMPVSL
jgi:hypothetical protein